MSCGDVKSVPLIGFAAWSGAGKTTLIEQLIPILKSRSLRVAVIKHAHHDFDIDQPGKDSYRLRHAGAQQTLIASRKRSVLITEFEDESHDPSFSQLLQQLDSSVLDLILVEGFRHEPIPKIEVHRPALGKPLLFPDDENVIAVATDEPLPCETTLPLLDLNDAVAVAEFISTHLLGMDEIDDTICPLCGGSNRCGRAEDSSCQSCWCQTVEIPQTLLDRIPAAARMRACICRNCIESYNSHHSE